MKNTDFLEITEPAQTFCVLRIAVKQKYVACVQNLREEKFMKIEKISIDEIKPYKNNAKLHPIEQIEQIKKSICEFGNNDPIAIDENNIIIEGHGRYEALKQLGFDEVEIIRLTHLNEQQKKAYILAHNKLTMNTGFDFDTLNLELDSISDFDMSDFGFTSEDNASPPIDNFIDDLWEKELGKREIAIENFEMTLIFPIEYKEKVSKYLAENGKQKLVNLCLNEMEIEYA